MILQNNSYKLHRKSNNLPVFIHKRSNHPPTILNELPKSVAKRTSDLSSGENIFAMLYLHISKPYEKVVFTSDLVHTSKQTDYNNNNEETKNKDV